MKKRHISYALIAVLSASYSQFATSGNQEDRLREQLNTWKAQCDDTYESTPNYDHIDSLYRDKRLFDTDIRYFKQYHRKQAVSAGSIEGLIEDRLCDPDRRLKLQVIGKERYNVAKGPMVCYLGVEKVLDNFYGVAQYRKGYDASEIANNAVDQCIDFYTHKYFGPTIKKLESQQ